MKVYAKHPLKYNNVWYMGGEEIDMSIPDTKELEEYIEIDEDDSDEGEDEAESGAPLAEEPVKRGRGRPKKSDA